jgi:serine O-acetyltransferase
MTRGRRKPLLPFARAWAYPLWCSVIRSESAADVVEDVEGRMRCINNDDLLRLGRYSQFAYFSGALSKFGTLVHYRLRSAHRKTVVAPLAIPLKPRRPDDDAPA